MPWVGLSLEFLQEIGGLSESSPPLLDNWMYKARQAVIEWLDLHILTFNIFLNFLDSIGNISNGLVALILSDFNSNDNGLASDLATRRIQIK
jgi:hypothetical protein